MQDPKTIEEAVAYARALMRDDPATFKAGYSLENAANAVAEVFGFDRKTLEDLLRAQ